LNKSKLYKTFPTILFKPEELTFGTLELNFQVSQNIDIEFWGRSALHKKLPMETSGVVRRSAATETPQLFQSYDSWDELWRKRFDETSIL